MHEASVDEIAENARGILMQTENAPPRHAFEALERAGIVPVVELPAVADAAPLLEALLAGGISTAEITLRTPAALDAIALLRGAYPDATIGAGTVRRTEDVARVAEAGAQFVVSPAVNVDLLRACAAAGIPAVPGTCTPTDVDTAVRAGVGVVKFFPAEAMGGVPFLRALIAPFRDVRFIPTGGISSANLRDYLRVPEVVACGGSWMVAPDLVREGEFDRVTSLAREAVAIVREVRDGIEP
jgi:2-dehydro-3-deoxyphosphogluconate aldolase/(4S)-4-hydroxy-2-oxoglutarate aldolase